MIVLALLDGSLRQRPYPPKHPEAEPRALSPHPFAGRSRGMVRARDLRSRLFKSLTHALDCLAASIRNRSDLPGKVAFQIQWVSRARAIPRLRVALIIRGVSYSDHHQFPETQSET